MSLTNRTAGRCIYCPSTTDTWASLTDEHIIPRQIGGTRMVLSASCPYHQHITSGVETACERQFFFNVRRHLGIVSLKNDKIRTEVQWNAADPIRRNYEGILREEHPGIFLIYAFMPPLILFGWPRIAGMSHMYPVPCFLYEGHVQNQTEFDRKHADKPIVLARDMDSIMYARMLAKIAHAYAVAELGPLGLRPYLIPLIEGKELIDASYFVGGSAIELPPENKMPSARAELHEIGFSPPPEPCPGATLDMIVVRIRLFSKFGAPAHYVVVGERCSASA